MAIRRPIPVLALVGFSFVCAALMAWLAGMDPPSINLDYFVLGALAIGVAPRSPATARALLVVGFPAILAIQFLQSALLPYMSGLAEGLSHVRYVSTWPWRSILPPFLLLAVAVFAIMVAARRTDLESQRAWPLVATGALVLLADAFGPASSLPARVRLYDVNIATSSAWVLTTEIRRSAMGPPEALILTGPTMRNDLARTDAPRILSIAVEAFGIYKDQRAQDALVKVLVDGLPDYEADYVERARHGATLAGELRELCALRLKGTPPVSMIEPFADRCLPRMLRDRGWATIGLHGHHGGFYNRAPIYEAIGFAERRFRKDMQQPDPPPCMRSLFGGICDVIVLQNALEFLSAHPRALAHVITLDTHFPLQRDGLADPVCPMQDDRICRYDTRMRSALEGIRHAIASAPAAPDIIYVYGDHPPPFAQADAQDQFKSDRVPVIVLRRRKGGQEN
ncbi:MAG: sulfatase-like hydrolase/transferase [Sandaracinobacter sp.]